MQTELNISRFNNDERGIIERYQAHNGNEWDLNELSQETLDLFYTLNDSIMKAQVSLEKYKKFIIDTVELQGANERIDYKLHDLSSYIWKNSERIRNILEKTSLGSDYDVFIDFCDLEWGDYQEWLKDENINLDKLTKYIGHTSKFQLMNLRLDIIAENLIENYNLNGHSVFYRLYDGDENDSMVYPLFDILDDVLEYHKDYFENDEYEHEESSIRQTIIDIIEDFEEIEIFEDYLQNDYRFADSLKVFKYIKDFKASSIESFECYLSMIEENYPKEPA